MVKMTDIFRSDLVTASCVLATLPGSGTTRDDERAIHALFDRYMRAIRTHDAEGWMALWDDEGVQLPPNQAMNIGKQAIRAANYGFIADNSRSWIFDGTVKEVLLISETFAVARGEYSYTATSTVGQPQLEMDGKFLSLLRRSPKGEWLLFRDCFNSNVPVK